MFATLFDAIKSPTPPRRKRKRRPADNRYRYTRRVKSNARQSRVWCGSHHFPQSVNLGMFTSTEHGSEHAEWLAGRLAKEFVNYYRPHEPGRGLRETFAYLKAKGRMPSSVLAPCVELTAEGYVGRASRKGREIATPPMACEWEAFELLREMYATAFPKRPSKVEAQQQAKLEREERLSRLLTLADFLLPAAAVPADAPAARRRDFSPSVGSGHREHCQTQPARALTA